MVSNRPTQRIKTSHTGSSPAPPHRQSISSHPFRPSTLASPQSSSEHRLRRLEFPAAIFLDWELFKQCQLDIPKATVPIPSYVSDRIGDAGNVENIASQYFDSIHTWMPIISKRRFYEQLSNPTTSSLADFALLVLSMKLLVSVPPHDVRDAQSTLYLCAKRYALEIESTAILTLKTMQAQLLITLYEMGHAVYPAAFMSLGTCVRSGQALGIQWEEGVKEAPTALTRAMSWVQLEEQHRVWWAVVILDRFMSVGCPQRPLSTRNPGEDVMYPANDTQWDEGVMPSRRIYGTSAAMAYELEGFAVVARSAALLGKVLTEHVKPKKNAKIDEAVSLCQTLRGFISDEMDASVPLHLQSSFCISALLLMHDLYRSRPSGAQLLESMKIDYSTIMSTIALRSSGDDDESQCPPGTICDDGQCSKHISPFAVTALYAAIVQTVRMLDDQDRPFGEGMEDHVNGKGGEEVDVKPAARGERNNLQDKVTRLKGKMEKVRGRWMLGSESPFFLFQTRRRA
jgi:hypothetical protein